MQGIFTSDYSESFQEAYQLYFYIQEQIDMWSNFLSSCVQINAVNNQKTAVIYTSSKDSRHCHPDLECVFFLLKTINPYFI